MKCALLAGVLSLTFSVGGPAGASPKTDTQNTVKGGSVAGWGSSGWGSSGYGDKPRAARAASDDSSTGKTKVTEPSNMMMLGLGLAGLIAGRMVARRRKKT